ncbi:flagellar biosynthesis protein FlhA [Thermosulfuriphilus ammonigenes]|uniref:Flagellar biosynthesis protein FlhA n=1 Tax=Thermosulfuriphilus ammonigenes TaxID=1936021 RepID=A0A6G7PY87_9BACT|nr:flagellar biosynthesis protein FlhA [Thermosulfuriphilus ammonigenes]MBA2849798.1 flagellar biosynthesis protein FlhA [Thermosulfuriphilus ammonigenes]QIJ72654.1 flagellar biosynthesis protein FlhA [Thermosulfuriphilus ammonigenes]
MPETQGRFLPAIAGIQIDPTNIFLALGVVAILLIMVTPLPPTLMDLLLAFNITFSLSILLISMYIIKPLDFTAFPALLLVTTLFRLSLNIASTRLILLHGHEGPQAAGKVIMGFGQFAVGGNYVVGAIVFAILVIINFVVITKGAGRIAEVAARFTLDAMPGKQMAIDADLNAGLIDETEAKRRREQIAKEAEFYGAMDGASKFVRGEAIAGLIIMAINVCGGLIIGVAQQGLPLAEAARSYTLLTIGDGLVSQIPALIVSTSAGIIVSRAAAEASMGRDFARQFALQPQALAVAAAVVFFFGLVPGMPTFPFVVLSAGMGTLAWIAYREKKALPKPEEEEAEEVPAVPEEESIEALIALDMLELEVGYGLIPLVDEDQGGDLLERIRSIRRQFAQELGIIVPPLHVRDNLQLKPGEYVILIKGVEVARAELMPGYLLAMDPGDAKAKIEGIPTQEPAFGLQAYWIREDQKDEAIMAGYTVVDLSTVVATHLAEVIKAHADELLGRQEVQRLLDTLAKTHPKAVEECLNVLNLGIIQKVLQNLLRERVSIRDLLTIVETLADYGAMTKDPDILTEYVRQRLSRLIVKPYLDQNQTLSVISLGEDMEEVLRQAIQKTDQGTFISLDPRRAHQVVAVLRQVYERMLAQGKQPVLLCSPTVRRHVRRLLERFLPFVAVLSHAELPPNIKVEVLEVVRLGHED